MDDKYISVNQLTKYIKYKIDNDINLNEVYLKGEISNFKAVFTGDFFEFTSCSHSLCPIRPEKHENAPK